MLRLSIFVLINMAGLALVCCSSELDILMPDVAPKTKDAYLCHKKKLDSDKPIFITEFQPNSTKEIAHHMLLYGCEEVMDEDVWSCGEMSGSKSEYVSGPICKGRKQSIIYAWAMDAPKLVLPEDVAFKVGGDTSIKYLVLQVHYANPDLFNDGYKDNSGLIMKVQDTPVKNTAAVFLMATGGYIQAHEKENFDTACQMTEDITIYPIAYRTHAHKLAIVNSGYLVRKDKNDEESWTEIGRRSPQLPQMFFPVTNKVEIKKGDVIAARCTMKNFRDHVVSVGPTGDDEMCNFYILYYVNGDKVLNKQNCVSFGPPYWGFRDFKYTNGAKFNLNKIPKDIGQVPADQEVELSDMDNHHGMYHNTKTEEKKNTKTMQDQLREFDTAIKGHNSQSSGSDESKENPDDYEEYLNELEKDYIFKQLLRKIHSRKQN